MNVIVVGASGFGRELLQYVQDAHRNTAGIRIKGFLDDDPAKAGGGVVGDTSTYPIAEDDRFVISLGDAGLRRALAERLSRRGARFVSIVHPTAYVAPSARIGDGCIVAPFAHVGAYAQVGDHVLLNVHSSAGHDSRIGPYCVCSPYSVVNGGSELGAGVFLGTHATITPEIRVGAGSRVAAGAAVYRDVPGGSLAAGNPARAFSLAETGSSSQLEQR